MKLITSDESLKLYLEDIRKTAPMNRQEEHQLFTLCRKGNKTAKQRLIEANMRFVLKVSLQYRGCPIPLPDLVSEGAMGLIRAIESFDHTRGLKFISYAVWWIKAYITRAINEQGSLIRLPANQHLKIRKALKDKNKVALSDDIKELINLGERGISFDAALKPDSNATYGEVLADEKAPNPESETELHSICTLAKELMSQLPEREAQVLKGLYGINHEAPQTLREIGEAMNVSHERVRQLRDQAFKRIRRGRNRQALREKYRGYIDAIAKVA